MQLKEIVENGFAQFEDRYPGFYQDFAYAGTLDSEIVLSDEIMKGEDIYELLDGLSQVFSSPESRDGVTGLIVSTTGWAAPIPKDGSEIGAPSEHPDRKRVRLVICALANGEMGSAMRLEGEEEIMVDLGEAVGPLADAVLHAFGV